jgi:hypothetical protein
MLDTKAQGLSFFFTDGVKWSDRLTHN